MRSLLLLIVQILLIQSGVAQSSKKIDWNADINLLAEVLPEKHYNLFSVKDKRLYLAGLEKIRSNSARLTDLQVALQLQQFIARFGDSHTRVDYSQLVDRNKILPLKLYWFSDGLFILHTTEENQEILGRQIVALNKIPLKTISDSLRTLITADNEAMVKTTVPELLPLVEILEYFGFVKGADIELTLKDLAGNPSTFLLKPGLMTRQNRKMFKPDSLALCYKNERIFFTDYYLPGNQTYYLQYNKCWSRELELQNGNAKSAENLPSFDVFLDRVLRTLQNESVKRIVFDMRFNEGGSSAQGTAFIGKLSKYSGKNSAAKIFVIIGRHTFSSAILNAMDFKRSTDAVFVGEETGGKPNHFGEVRNFILPASGIRVDYSTKYFKRTSDNVNTITPDIALETSFSDFKRGVDPAYEWIVKN